jgi:hypothetical protein
MEGSAQPRCGRPRSSWLGGRFAKPTSPGSNPGVASLASRVGFGEDTSLTQRRCGVRIPGDALSGCSSAVRISGCQSEGHGFDPRHPLLWARMYQGRRGGFASHLRSVRFRSCPLSRDSSVAGLTHLPVTQEIAGSSPVYPVLSPEDLLQPRSRRGCSSVVRAPGSHPGGRGFDPHYPLAGTHVPREARRPCKSPEIGSIPIVSIITG